MSSRKENAYIRTSLRTPNPSLNYEQRMQTILAQDTDYISSLIGPEFQEFVDWLERSTIPDADKLRAALIERRQLMEQRDKLDAELYDVRRRRAAKFGPIGSLLFWLTQKPPSNVATTRSSTYTVIILCIVLLCFAYYWNSLSNRSEKLGEIELKHNPHIETPLY